MRYIALLRGINVGGHRKVEMKRLRTLLETLGYTNVVSYLNSGNIIFDSEIEQEILQKDIPKQLADEFGLEIPTLVRSELEVKRIADAIPDEWKNDLEQKSDVAYLFPEIDSEKTMDKLPLNKELIDLRYIEGAILWNLKKKDYNKSRLNKIISLEHYQFMTVRNVNTARFLAGKK